MACVLTGVTQSTACAAIDSLIQQKNDNVISIPQQFFGCYHLKWAILSALACKDALLGACFDRNYPIDCLCGSRPTWLGMFVMAVKILHRAWEERAAAYCMYFLESNEPSQDKQLTILAFAVGADSKRLTGDGDATDE